MCIRRGIDKVAHNSGLEMHPNLNNPRPNAIEQDQSLNTTKTLPHDYEHYHALNLSNWKLMLITNAAGIILLFLFGWLFIGLAAALNPTFFTLEISFLAQTLTLQVFFLTILLVVILHEVCHAIFFWLFTHERPKIGFNLLYAYAAAPDWHFPRNKFILIGLAPFLLITLGGVIWLFGADFLMIPRLILALTLNAAGSVGDLLVMVWLMTQPANSLVKDEGAQITLFTKAKV
ncbi:MAG: DUF3267 domain-containing protein [Chloroflexi bacterium]|nr:MAG: DUF3267 domain-containing protein [Chloroflexota bacterium]